MSPRHRLPPTPTVTIARVVDAPTPSDMEGDRAWLELLDAALAREQDLRVRLQAAESDLLRTRTALWRTVAERNHLRVQVGPAQPRWWTRILRRLT